MTDEAHDAMARLSRLAGPAEWRAAALALAIEPASSAAVAAWAAETREVAHADALLADVRRVADAARLPALDAMLCRLGRQPKPERRLLLQSARRLMAAHAPRRPLDRLHWLLMRRRLGDAPPGPAWPASMQEFADLPEPTLLHIARVTAYLSRMVPGRDATAARAWYADAMRRLLPHAGVPDLVAPDGDGFVHALEHAQALPWMLRPVLVRAWVDAAGATSLRARLPAGAADALRLVAALLDCPLPPDLARHYVEVDWR